MRQFREIWDQANEVDLDEPRALREYLHQADGLYTHLDAHHSIEVRSANTPFSIRPSWSPNSRLLHHTFTGLDRYLLDVSKERYFFPLLAKRMPQFTAKTGRHLQEHAEMHDGLIKYHAYITACLNSSGAHYSAAKMRAQMQVFEKVLFEHMDEEVRSLSAESMWEAGWTEREMREFPM